ncbi:ubiquitin thioesterase OTU1 [Salpingoeca rosetta]|uniref:Ubiquitin thioesterase OTU n=1 Tax=Salpingoeca rosetta (strain ATCC 50818 / BSB-021) TaxID=946362 RepID=F2URJ1_SALR5|nr:ubiquitin thioesterase OTU1 [Salpingoeca rosetta]EGD80160.1 ubiquitin thioesterase OTU1 [Salpingoeca rosetta]|eukprot:XP_004988222.1 ubiquitin thioesterase OTU1 [Salpingoeca rosetta]
MTLRYRVCIGSQRPQVMQVAQDATFGELREEIARMAAADASDTHISFGFPPQEITDIADDTRLADTDLARGGNLKHQQQSQQQSQQQPGQGPLLWRPHPLRVSVPADNSCLFRTLVFLLDCPPGGMAAIADDNIMTMRLMVASLVQSDPDRFTSAVLGKPVDEYLAWITDSSHWGGYIELTAIARAFATTILAIDIQTLRVDEYSGGEDAQCCYVLYDGIHYDPLVIANTDDGNEEMMTKLFARTDTETYEAMVAFARELHDLRQFTNVQDFALMCLDCQKGLRGQEEAREHSQLTGHINFCEVES